MKVSGSLPLPSHTHFVLRARFIYTRNVGLNMVNIVNTPGRLFKEGGAHEMGVYRETGTD